MALRSSKAAHAVKTTVVDATESSRSRCIRQRKQEVVTLLRSLTEKYDKRNHTCCLAIVNIDKHVYILPQGFGSKWLQA
jgi:hypothetical protein